MPYRILEIKELDTGGVYFTAEYWSDTDVMGSGTPPDWRNDFVTDLDRLAVNGTTKLKFQHDSIARSSRMQRADSGEWLPVRDWVREGGLLQHGVAPAYESVTADSTTVHTAINAMISAFKDRREAAASRNESWTRSSDYQDLSLRSHLSNAATLPDILLAESGRTEESI